MLSQKYLSVRYYSKKNHNKHSFRWTQSANYNGGLGTVPPAGSKSKAYGHGTKPLKQEKFIFSVV